MTTAMADPIPEEPALRVLAPDGQLDAASDPGLPAEQLLRVFRELVRLRMVDARLTALHRQGRIGPHLSSLGQEVAPVVVGLVSRAGDWVFPALRESGVMLVRGFGLERYLAQVFGSRGDVLKGRQAPGHMSSRDANLASWSSCVGTQLTHAVGVAWAARQRRDSTVSIAFLGDGATSAPDFHAAMNFAAVFQVPCVFICQNNQYAASTPTQRQTAASSIAVKGRAYAVGAHRVDGNDALAMYQAVSDALATSRRGGGPVLIESVTYRLASHSTSDDPTRYRPQAEWEHWAQADPLRRLQTYLRGRGLLSDSSVTEMENAITAEIDRAVVAAESEGPPDRATLFDDVVQGLPWHLAEQRDELLRHPPVGTFRLA